jgi:SNF2 family DNA or RNA helicase
LLAHVSKVGVGQSGLQILEALLRLRQAACHPGLVSAARQSDPSSKLELLLEHLKEAITDGHKALVFSQFTSLLALVRPLLTKAGIPFEYLDGRTRDRETRVTRFQDDPACPVFLVSLKAGGIGLNLTAADYVFLLDPWWNPAVEAQAIDRTHRIGQTKEVFAYRLIAEDTVEEKVLALQQSKRELADAVLSANPIGLRGLSKDDLDLLLS